MKTAYYNGAVLTMKSRRCAQAVLVENGRILAVGSDDEILFQADTTVDLKGCCMLPGFIDPHSHITQLATTLDLVPLGSCTSNEALVQALRRALPQTKPGTWLIGFGYDNNSLPGKQHPDKHVLDAVSDTVPILISHASGHMGCVNSAALAAMGITNQTPDPAGGRIGRLEGSTEPSGYLEENAFIQLAQGAAAPSAEQLFHAMHKAQQVYASYGITTVQDGLTKQNEFALLDALAQQHALFLDIVAYPDMKEHASLLQAHPQYAGQYHNRLKLGGYKIFLDGSPQGRTAWLSQPYEKAEDGYCGYPIYQDEQVLAFCERAVMEGRQLLAHCNGDAAAQQYIDAYAQALHRHPGVGRDLRPVMIHAQTLRSDQLPALKHLGMIPSFFLAHVYHWGETHVENLGLSRAEAISPAKSACQLGIPYTFHQDTPVIAPNMLETLWCAVNRKTKQGRILGAEERLDPYQALCGITCHAAYQYFEEHDKGALAPGMRADLVILDRNPCQVPPEELNQLQVLCTIKDGTPVFQA